MSVLKKGDVVTYYLLYTRQRNRRTIAQIIHHSNTVVCVYQFNYRVGTDISGPACDEDVHTQFPSVMFNSMTLSQCEYDTTEKNSCSHEHLVDPQPSPAALSRIIDQNFRQTILFT